MYDFLTSWWRHQMEAFSALLAICAGNSPVPGEFPVQRPVTRSFDVFFELSLNKRLSKQSGGWWLETLSSPLWRHRNDFRPTKCIWKCRLQKGAILSWLQCAKRRIENIQRHGEKADLERLMRWTPGNTTSHVVQILCKLVELLWTSHPKQIVLFYFLVDLLALI